MNQKNPKQPVLEVKDLSVRFHTKKGVVTAVDGVDFTIQSGEILGIVGESGCGKSVTSLSILGLLSENAEIGAQSRILFEGENLLELTEKQMCAMRGKAISMIFQDPMTSLNPMQTIGHQLAEAAILHRCVSKKQAREDALRMLQKVGIPSPEQRLNEYPHQLSGGMKQRVMIAMAMMCEPKLLIADEPTTALDVTIQAQILKLMKSLQRETGTAVMLITHDMGVVAYMSDAILVMYAGRVVEYGSADRIFNRPIHPYAIGLLNSRPRLDKDVQKLYTIEGTVPNQYDMPEGCKFAPRCPYATEQCHREEPRLLPDKEGAVRCFRAQKEETASE